MHLSLPQMALGATTPLRTGCHGQLAPDQEPNGDALQLRALVFCSTIGNPNELHGMIHLNDVQPSNCRFSPCPVDRWNAGDHDSLMAGYRDAAPGGLTIEFPIGAPIADGHQMLEGIWQAHASHVRLHIDTCIVNAGEGALCVSNTRHDAAGTAESVNMSIELYRFAEDGSLHIRWFNQAAE